MTATRRLPRRKKGMLIEPLTITSVRGRTPAARICCIPRATSRSPTC